MRNVTAPLAAAAPRDPERSRGAAARSSPGLAAWERRRGPSLSPPDGEAEWAWELFAASPAAVVLTSAEGLEVAANDAARRLVEPWSTGGERFLGALGPEAWDLGRIAAATGDAVRREVRCFSPRAVGWIEVQVVPLPSGHLAWYLNDVSVVHARQRALEESEQRYRQLAEQLGEVFWVLDFAGRHVLYASAAFETVWGRTLSALYTDAGEWLAGVHPDDRPALLEARRAAAAGVPFQVEYRVVRPDGGLRHILDRGTPCAAADGREAGRLLGIAEDVTPFKLVEEALRRQAWSDPLTGLLNRRAFSERLRQEAARAQRRGGALAVAMVDVDRLKEINDRHGHATGDAALLAVAAVFGQRLRVVDTAARLGGDELGLVLPDTGGEEARVVCEDLCRRLRQAPVGTASNVEVSVSIGVASLLAGESAESLLQRADEALLAVKRDCRGRVRLAAPPAACGRPASAPPVAR